MNNCLCRQLSTSSGQITLLSSQGALPSTRSRSLGSFHCPFLLVTIFWAVNKDGTDNEQVLKHVLSDTGIPPNSVDFSKRGNHVTHIKDDQECKIHEESWLLKVYLSQALKLVLPNAGVSSKVMSLGTW